ncbi:phosphotransferase [Herbidospora sp. NEAU-GS84]|uniref:Phosphotransferase n=1 Tax=Herbidospora solisilvae TaxID=2696284 RepID=A0A7C9J5L6_9ACTN|nr:aminoglycoside phosphotransferase family protein [Herbidospora solisilvae]NAS25347.1 phosphotransferase [Herbidospora solisilvae]
MHASQLTVSTRMVRVLVDEQFPQWRDLAVTGVVSHGTVNAIFRIGDRYTARFPLQPPGGVESTRRWLEAEAEAARELAGRTRFRTPEPVALGEPGAGYPVPWSVQTWLPGVVATDDHPGESVGFAHDLADLVTGLRAIDTRGRTFSGGGRGGDIDVHDEWVETCFRQSEALLDVPRLRKLWADFRVLPRRSADVMTHGDLLPGNVLVSGGRLTGVLDVGGFGAADPALDLLSAWNLLENGPREVFRELLGVDDLEWERGKAWAFVQAIGCVWYYVRSNPVMAQLGRRCLDRLLDDTRP